MVGTLVAAVGLAWLSRITPSSTFVPDLLGPFLLLGAGLGLSVTPVTVSATNGVPREDAGLASGLLNTSRTVGASIGLAALATVAADRTTALLGGVASTPAAVASAVTAGYARAIAVGAVILLVAGIVAALVVPPLRRTSPEVAIELTEPDASDLGEVVLVTDVTDVDELDGDRCA
jgi:hypothetical protein